MAEHEWRTLYTPHFEIHFHEGLYPLALRSARGLEAAHRRLVPLLGAEPTERTQVVLTDDTDSANGSATAAIRPRINLRAVPPDDLSVLNDHDDYLLFLVTHEYVHVLHLGTVGGLPEVVNLLLGDVLTPNGYQPNFVTEGLAVYEESQLGTSGRNRSALFDMFLRAQALDDSFFTLSELANGAPRWPRGTASYLYGGRLMAFLAETRGDEALLRYSHLYGENTIPFAQNLALASAADVDFISLYDEWMASLKLRYAGQLAAIRAAGPITEPELVTRHGERTGAPRFGPAGRSLFYVEASPDRRPHLRRLDLGGPEATRGEAADLGSLGTEGELAPLPQGGVLLARPESFEVRQSFGDLFLVNEDGEQRLTHGLRASELDVSADGKTAYFVRRGSGRTTLERIRPFDPEPVPQLVYAPPSEREIFTPRLSPDGQHLVLSERRPGSGRDVVLLHLDETGHATVERRLTDDVALDLDPSFSPDGGTVYFSSDRSGVYNVYSVPITGGAPLRITNVLTGALQPAISPDGEWLAFTTYSSRGFDVAATRLSSLSPAPAPLFVPDRPEPGPADASELYPVRRYSAAEGLWPRYWLPYAVGESGGLVLGALTSGGDEVGLHSYALSAGWGIDTGEPQASAAWSYHGLFPELGAALATGARGVPGFAAGTTERYSSANVSASFPWSSSRSAQELRLGYEAVYLDPLRHPGALPGEGLITEAQLSLSYSSTERPAEAISQENGLNFSLEPRFASPALGGDFAYGALLASAAAYLRLPWASHHVLSLQAAGASSAGDVGQRGLFSLGGPVLRDPLLDLVYTGAVLSRFVLRGYDPGAFSGDRLVLGTVEYRLPLTRIDVGPFSLPLWLGRLSGAAFAEAGDAANSLALDGLHPSAGLELRLDVGAGFTGGSLRLGGAWGFDEPAGGPHLYLGIGVPF